MWSETVGRRRRPVSDQKVGLGLAGLVLCCETRFVTLIFIMILKDRTTFQVLFIVSLFHAFTYLEVKSAKCIFYFR